MATFLQLVQKLGAESGTVSGSGPTTVVGQTGRSGKLVKWVADAYRDIENARRGWQWMQGIFSDDTAAGVQAFTPAATRFAEFVHDGSVTENRYSVFDPDIGRASEGQLQFATYHAFFVNFMRGANADRLGKPTYFTLAPDGTIMLYPTPDKAYTVRGPYRKDSQPLTADDDVPEMPVRFHDIIVDAALVRLGTHDEAAPPLSLHQLRMLRNFTPLELSQLPRMTFAETLA